MIDLNPHIPPDVQKRIGPLTMSDRAAAELAAVLEQYGHGDKANPAGLGPTVAHTVIGFLDSPYHRQSDWFRRQTVHRLPALFINPDDPSEPTIAPPVHLQKTRKGYTVTSCEETVLPASYYEDRLLAEIKVEIGIPEARPGTPPNRGGLAEA